MSRFVNDNQAVNMLLKIYIGEVGEKQFAKRLKVTERRVQSWRLGQRFPRPEMARRIERLTGHKVSFKECYE